MTFEKSVFIVDVCDDAIEYIVISSIPNKETYRELSFHIIERVSGNQE